MSEEQTEAGGPLPMLDQLIAASKTEISTPDLIKNYLAPLFREVIEDYDSQLNEIDDQVAEIIEQINDEEEQNLLADAESLIQKQSILILGLSKEAGFLDTDGFTEKMPANLQAFFTEINEESAAFQKRHADLEINEAPEETETEETPSEDD